MPRSLLAGLMFILLACSQALAQTTAFTFQGRLTSGGAAASGTFSMQFKLFDAAGGGTQQGATLSQNVAVDGGLFTARLDFGAQFSGAARFLEVTVSGTTLLPRVEITSAPYAVKDASSWALAGNASTNASTQFVGTTDSQPLNLRAANRRGLRLEFSTNAQGNGINFIGGNRSNAVTAGAVAGTIAGGGITDATDDNPNLVTDNFGTVGGGINNRAGDNDADPSNHTSATVGGGAANTASGFGSTVAGGQTNLASGDFSAVPGGRFNSAIGATSFALGNRAKANHDGAFVWADHTNADFASTAADQFLVRAANGVGINTTSPQDALHVVGDARVVADTNVSTTVGSGSFKIVNTAGTAGLHFDTNEILCLGSTVFALNGSNACETRINSTVFITTSNLVGIGDSSPAFRLELPNTASDTGGRGRANAWTTYSSARWKTNITPIENALDKVLALRGVMFDWKPENGGTHDIGFVAEEVGRVVPELVSYEADGVNAKGMNYDRVTALLVEAVKEQHGTIETLKAENDSLRARLDRVESALTQATTGK
jgi:hypothetical protein